MNDWTASHDSYLTSLDDAGVLTLTLNAPEARNPFRQHMSAEFTRLFTRAQADPAVRALLITGAGGHFSSGGDIAGFQRALSQPTADLQAHFHQRLTIAADMVAALIAFDRPVITRLRGAVAGAGMLFPLASDLVLADDSALFVFAYNRLGLSPDGGVSWLLPRVVGARIARRLLVSMAQTGAEEALRLGLIDELLPADRLEAAALSRAQSLARGAQGASARTKALLNAAAGNDLRTHLEAERDGIVASVGHPDFAEAVTAFMDKRKPNFR